MSKLFKVEITKWAGETGLRKPGTQTQVQKKVRDFWISKKIAKDVEKPKPKRKQSKTK